MPRRMLLDGVRRRRLVLVVMWLGAVLVLRVLSALLLGLVALHRLLPAVHVLARVLAAVVAAVAGPAVGGAAWWCCRWAACSLRVLLALLVLAALHRLLLHVHALARALVLVAFHRLLLAVHVLACMLAVVVVAVAGLAVGGAAWWCCWLCCRRDGSCRRRLCRWQWRARRRLLSMLSSTLLPSVSSLPISLTPFLLALLILPYEVGYAVGHETDAAPIQRCPVVQSTGGRVLPGTIRAALAPTLLNIYKQ